VATGIQQNVAEVVASTPTRRRWQYSIRTAIFLIAFLVVVISHIRTTLDLQVARGVLKKQTAEIGRLRGELGIFEIEDSSKAHVLGIRLKEPDAYRFRVYLPPRKREYEICIGTQGVSLSGVPGDMYQFQPLRGGGVTPVDGTSFFVDVFLAKNPSGQYQWHVRHPRGEMFEPFMPFAVGGQSHLAAGNSVRSVVLSDPNEPIILVRWIPSEGFSGAGSQGLAVWIR